MPALIALAYLSLFALGLVDNIRGPFLYEIQRELNLSGTGGSAFFAATSLLACAGSWYSHRLLGRRDPLKVLCGVSLLLAFGFALISRAPNFALLLAGAAVFGLAYGMLNVLQNVIVCEASGPDLRRRYLNGLQGMYGLASLLAPLTATSMRVAGWDWRGIFLALAALPVLVAASAWHFRGQVKAGAGTAPMPLARGRWAAAGFAALLAIYLWGELSLSTRLVLWLRTERGFSPESADSQLAIFFVLLLAGRLLFAFVHFKKLSNAAIMMASVFLSAAFYGLGLGLSPYFLPICGLTLAPFFPVLMDQIAASFGAGTPRSMGLIIGIGNLSIVAMHLTVGALTDVFDLSAALTVGPAALILAGCAIFWAGLKEKR